MLRILWLIAFMSCSLYSCSDEKEQGKDNRPELLKKLDGQWIMTGHVMGDSVQYRMTAGPAISNRYTQVHMTDVNTPPGYEALIFIGEESTIEFQIPYEPSAFRDRFTYEPAEDSWTLVIDARNNSLNTW